MTVRSGVAGGPGAGAGAAPVEEAAPTEPGADPEPAGRVDLNADVGESYGRWQLGDDEALLAELSSANIACGFHAGDPATLWRTCRLAVAAEAVIGAQVGYHDLAGFGRRFLDVDPADLAADVLYQIGALQGLAAAVGSRVRYVKPHGALYHACIDHEEQAVAVLDGIEAARALTGPLAVLGWPGSALLRLAADRGLPTVAEAFADRRYGEDGRLVDRRSPGALVTDPAEAAEQAVALAQEGAVGSLCVHGDTAGAVSLAAAVRRFLLAAGVVVRPFA